MVYYLAALLAALCWAVSSMISVSPAQALGSVAFNRLRINLVFITMLLITLVSYKWVAPEWETWGALLLSGFVGIFIGDTLLFATLNRVGPRRTQILFSSNALITFALSLFLFPDALLSAESVLGSMVLIAGVFTAIAFGRKYNQSKKWEETKGSLTMGVLCGLAAASCQSFGVIIAKPVLEAGFNPIAASTLRIGIAGIALLLFGLRKPPQEDSTEHIGKTKKEAVPYTPYLVFRVYCSGMLGMAIGMTLVVFALKGGHPGVVSALASSSPVFLLPLIWHQTRKMPSTSAWLAACMILVGCTLIFWQ